MQLFIITMQRCYLCRGGSVQRSRDTAWCWWRIGIKLVSNGLRMSPAQKHSRQSEAAVIRAGIASVPLRISRAKIKRLCNRATLISTPCCSCEEQKPLQHQTATVRTTVSFISTATYGAMDSVRSGKWGLAHECPCTASGCLASWHASQEARELEPTILDPF